MEFLNACVHDINGYLWGVYFLIPLLCGTGIFYTIRLRFVQVRYFGWAARYLFGGASLFGKKVNLHVTYWVLLFAKAIPIIEPSVSFTSLCSIIVYPAFVPFKMNLLFLNSKKILSSINHTSCPLSCFCLARSILACFDNSPNIA